MYHSSDEYLVVINIQTSFLTQIFVGMLNGKAVKVKPICRGN